MSNHKHDKDCFCGNFTEVGQITLRVGDACADFRRAVEIRDPDVMAIMWVQLEAEMYILGNAMETIREKISGNHDNVSITDPNLN